MALLPELPRTLAWRSLFAALLGAANVLSFAPFGLFWLMPPVLLGLMRLWHGASGWRAAAWLGFCFGLGFFLAGVSWIYVSLSVFGGMPGWMALLATVLFCAFMAIFPALIGACWKKWNARGAIEAALAFGAMWAIGDWIRSWFLTGFPWLVLGYAQAQPSPLAGFAPILGVFGLSWLVATMGGLLACGQRGMLSVVVLGLAGWGLTLIEWTEPVGQPVSVALVQGNVSQDKKWRPDQFYATLRLYRDLVDRHPAQLTLLPETAVPAFWDQVPPAFIDDMRRLAQRKQGDLILGTATGEGKSYWNTAVSLGASSEQAYRKTHLVPFGELIPPGFSWFLGLINMPMASFSRGEPDQKPFEVAGQRLALNICYEDAFGDEIARAVPPATILANLSNTAWFGDSLAQPQHLQISSLRALETGRPMLRATNTGITAIIRPDGRIQDALPAFTQAVLRAEIRGYQGTTPFLRTGNALPLCLALGVLLTLVWRRRAAKPE